MNLVVNQVTVCRNSGRNSSDLIKIEESTDKYSSDQDITKKTTDTELSVQCPENCEIFGVHFYSDRDCDIIQAGGRKSW